jgi:hypothetical protein
MPDAACGTACLPVAFAILAVLAAVATERAASHEKSPQEAGQILASLELDLDRAFPVDQLCQLWPTCSLGGNTACFWPRATTTSHRGLSIEASEGLAPYISTSELM